MNKIILYGEDSKPVDMLIFEPARPVKRFFEQCAVKVMGFTIVELGSFSDEFEKLEGNLMNNEEYLQLRYKACDLLVNCPTHFDNDQIDAALDVFDQVLAKVPDVEQAVTAERDKFIEFVNWLDNGTRSSASWRSEVRKFKQDLKGGK